MLLAHLSELCKYFSKRNIVRNKKNTLFLKCLTVFKGYWEIKGVGFVFMSDLYIITDE